MKQNIKAKLLLIALIATTFIIAGCNELTTTPSEYRLSDDISISSFSSESEFRAFLDENEHRGYYGGFAQVERMGSFETVDMVMDAAIPQMVHSEAKASDSLDFSETNVQVQGVDELDIIKTDGNFIYTSSGRDVFIILSHPASDAEILSTLSLKNRVTGLFIDGDVLAVAGIVEDFDELRDKGFSSRTQLTFLDLYDVSDRNNPVLLKEYRFDGSFFNARLYDGVVYLATNYNPFNRPHPLPIIITDGVVRTMSASDIFIYDRDYDSPSFVGIHSVDMLSQNNIDSKILTLDGSNHLYMSYDNIYITYSEIINRYEIQQEIMIDKILPRLPSQDRDFINRVKAIDNDILNKHEKNNKILEVVQRYVMYLDQNEQDKLQEQIELETKREMIKLGTLEYTVIHKVNVNEGHLNFESAGRVPGFVYGQFALDEHDGVLRVATTIRDGMMITKDYDPFDWRSRSPAINNVYTLDSDMNIIGSLEGLAPTESIFSARYVGDRLYLVTFRQIDPFFVIDLSDPRNPKDLGELKITGYSRYLHPFDENTIIGLGREGTETGRILGIKISLFDVTDVSNPKEIVTFVSEDSRSSSGAEWEHKAFLFSRERELLVIPAQNYDWQNPENNYAGALVFKINKQEISPRGIITHSQGSDRFRGGVERSLYIEDNLFTKSENLLRINNIDTLESIKNISLSTQRQGSIPVY